jgi:crossover junction endodeoxyribonuclease RuvC
MTLVLGIDPGTATIGYALVRDLPDGNCAAVDYGVITTPKEDSAPARLVQLYERLNEILSLHHPDSAAVEKLFFQKNISTAIAVGQARGVVLLALAQARLEVGEYTPNEVKQAVTGYGSADKNKSRRWCGCCSHSTKSPSLTTPPTRWPSPSPT